MNYVVDGIDSEGEQIEIECLTYEQALYAQKITNGDIWQRQGIE